MRRTLILLGLAAVCLLPTTGPQLHAQGGVEIQDFYGESHPLRRIVRLIWIASEDSTLTSFTVEHSLDTLSWTEIGTVPAVMTGNRANRYEYWHLSPPLGVNYYRLFLNFANGERTPTRPIKVLVARPNFSWPTFPINPDSDDTDASWLEARVTDLYGRPVATMKGQSDMEIPDLPSGVYVLHVRDEIGWHASTFVVAETGK